MNFVSYLSIILARIAGVIGILSPPIRKWLHLSKTPSGAPLTNILGPFPIRDGLRGEQYVDMDLRSLKKTEQII